MATTGNIKGIEITEDNTDAILKELKLARERAMTMIGIKAEKYAKALCPVGTPESTGKKGYRGGTLRNSITFNLKEEEDSTTMELGTNVEYAPYVELGTGPFFEAPPEWLEFDAHKGSGMPGVGYVRPRPFIKPAIADHTDTYKKIIEKELGK